MPLWPPKPIVPGNTRPPVNIMFTIDRINAMLRAEGMPPCEDFTRSIPGISREAQACGALERKFRYSGLDLEHVRYWMKDGRRVKMLLGERVNELELRYGEMDAPALREMIERSNPGMAFSETRPPLPDGYVDIPFELDRLHGTGGITITYDLGKEPNDG